MVYFITFPCTSLKKKKKKKKNSACKTDAKDNIITYTWQTYFLKKKKKKSYQSIVLHRNFPHAATVLWQGSNDMMTILSSTSGTSGRLQNRLSVLPWFLHSD